MHVVKLNFNGFGRPYDEEKVSLATLKSEYRKYISVPCVDFDIVNSQPTIIKKICKEIGQKIDRNFVVKLFLKRNVKDG